MLTRQGPVNKKTRSLSSPTEKISYGGPERNGTCPRSHSCAKAVSPMVCDYGLSKSLALGSRDLVWTPVHLCSHKGQCLLSGLVRPPAGADLRGQRHLAVPGVRASTQS